jgi:hypothetical protein
MDEQVVFELEQLSDLFTMGKFLVMTGSQRLLGKLFPAR